MICIQLTAEDQQAGTLPAPFSFPLEAKNPGVFHCSATSFQQEDIDISPRKTIVLTILTFVGKVMSLLFNMLSRFVIAFVSRNIFFFFNLMTAFLMLLCFGPAVAFFLELLIIALCSSSVAYLTLSDLRGSSSNVIYFCLFITFMGFWQQEYWRKFPFPPSEDHVLPEYFK